MTISVWRYSHLALAVSSFLLLTLAAITGIILSFEPVAAEFQSYRVDGFDKITLNQTLPLLRQKYQGITEIKINPKGFVEIKGTDDQGGDLLSYVDPIHAKRLGVPQQQTEFFQWVTGLHRSLFLHETGRFFIGLTAFLLLLITVSGIILLIQRQRGIRRFFTKITRDSFAQYYHVMLSRWSLVPVFVIALSGTYLSMVRFELLNVKTESPKVDFDAIRTEPVRKDVDFEVFKGIHLSEVESVEFPFSEDAEDYYTLKLKTGELAVNQVTGDLLGETHYPAAVSLANLSLNLHTGRASGLWAFILAAASVNILFFIYSGFAITLKRRSNRTRNTHKAEESKFIILVGSENGSTYGFAAAIHRQLLRAGEKSFITELNNYTVFPKATHFIIVTATYGLGDPPANATKFMALLEKHPQQQQIHYSVLGLGSHAYPDFCKFAFSVNLLLSAQEWAKPLTDIHTVNDKSPEDFSLWAEAWSQQSGVQIAVSPELYASKKALQKLKVLGNSPQDVAAGDTFMLNLHPGRSKRVTSGDLLAIYPANDHRERLYSIAVINKQIQLHVKLHAEGLGSGYLQRLQPGQKISARIINNTHFHFPAEAAAVVMISNGTGIAPFLGMISQNSRQIPCHLYCGFREFASYSNYQPMLEESKSAQKVLNLNPAFSREGGRQYVNDLVERDATMIAEVLAASGVIMICGSLAMQKDVMETLEKICQLKSQQSVSHYESRGQILTDCY
ncbi:PepSY domain-containing protein [Pedobacter sp. MC2016-15]|uniref:PepSY domain-containing protein n=1 Tax=Pedobacter sp. MC2016-15 TaxID=2994473 RepID=UPI00224710BF|nr:PepSY domain-containing protein [Pedobacter sp. MC2016-15]MCX2480303.1 PepSY domain-containing protein [Pedobacter sp. MC2016-15]